MIIIVVQCLVLFKVDFIADVLAWLLIAFDVLLMRDQICLDFVSIDMRLVIFGSETYIRLTLNCLIKQNACKLPQTLTCI